MGDHNVPEESKIFVGIECLNACRGLWHILVLLDREVRRIGDRAQARDERGFNLTDRLPVDASEERVPPDRVHVQSAVL